jgi:hypothetical protein
MTESKKPFTFLQSELYLNLLAKIVANPPSDRMMDVSLLNLIKDRLLETTLDSRETFVWNLYKEILDDIVRHASAAPAIYTLMNLEDHYDPPVDVHSVVFSQQTNNMHLAPWRKEREHSSICV